MRIAICPRNLAASRGFKRTAKCMRRDWLTSEPIRLPESQDIYARCSGEGHLP